MYVCKQSDSVSISLRRAYSKIEMNSVERSGERGSPLEVDGIARLDVVLRENELEWRHIADAIAVNVVVQSTTGTCLFANRTALEYWGLNLDDVMVANYRAPVHADDAAQMYARRQDGLAKGISFETELRSRRRDGEYRWFLWRYGGTSGWHSHPGPVLVVVKTGTITFYRAGKHSGLDGDDENRDNGANGPTCSRTVYAAGSAFVEVPAPGHVMLAKNEGSTEATVTATYFAPPGAALRIDRPWPGGNCPQ